MSDAIDLSTLTADQRARLASYNSLALLQALATVTVTDPSGDETIAGNLRRSVAVPAAAGTNQGSATALTADLNAVTLADGTKGVKLPVSVAGDMIEVINTVTTAGLKVYPPTGDIINALSANAAFVVGPGRDAAFRCSVVGQWYVADSGQGTATTTEANTLAGITSTAAELNQLHSQGAVTTDFAKLHAVTSSAAEINQLAAQGAVTTDFAKLHALTSSAAEVNQLAGQGAVTTDFAKLHGITAAAATLNQVAAAAGTVNFDRSVKVAKVALTALDTGGGVFSWANPEAGSIIITKAVLDVTTKSNAGCTVDVGTTSASAATLSDNLIDGVDVGTSAIIADNITTATPNGKSVLKLATGKWVTGSMASGAAAGLIGAAYIYYVNA